MHFDHIVPDTADPELGVHRLVGESSRSMVDPSRPAPVRGIGGETALLGCVVAVAVEAVLLEGLRGQGNA